MEKKSTTSEAMRRIRDGVAAVGLVMLVVSLVFGALYVVFDRALDRWTDRDLEHRARLIGRAAGSGPAEQLADRMLSLADDERVTGILACSQDGSGIATPLLPGQMSCASPLVRRAIRSGGRSVSERIGGHNLHLVSVAAGGNRKLVIVQDRTFIEARRQRMLQVLIAGAYVVALAILILMRMGMLRGRRGAVNATRDLFNSIDEGTLVPTALPPELRRLADDFTQTLTRLRRHRPDAHEESGPARLRQLVNSPEFGDASLVVVANREPYIHERSEDGSIRVRRPPSGLVTGVEPVLRACGGTWIAHGSGSADRETCDREGRLPVPPEAPEYVLRRLWLSDDEYDGYYLGFANEGLWPLCHIAHTRPTFRSDDWNAYRTVNQRFAEAAVAEGAGSMILVQDYHFALVPRFVRELSSEAELSLFWHIPWPNWEVIGICPWKDELLDGMLGADVIGFHTRFHCLNFLETVQRFLECRVDLASMSVEYRGKRTVVRTYPISVEWPYPSVARETGRFLRQPRGIADDVHVIVGVDRADYTKGLLERIAAIEAVLERRPDLAGRFALVQLAAPSRTRIKKYRDLVSDVEDAAQRVNRRFSTSRWKPIHLEIRNFTPEEVRAHYAMAGSALVTPLHDGMNLVAKEYVAACADGDGVLVLSRFAGAAQELDGALVVNPYDAEAVATAIIRAIEMPLEEKRARMHVMREQISRNSIYDWSASMLRDLIAIRTRRDRLWPRPADTEAAESA
jgi:trehalose-6-phosphate synthase